MHIQYNIDSDNGTHSDNPLDEWGYDVVVYEDSDNGTHFVQNEDKLIERQNELVKILTNEEPEHLDFLEEFVDVTKKLKGWE